MRLLRLLVGIGLFGWLAVAAHAGVPISATGIDLIVGDAAGRPGDVIRPRVTVVPGPDDGAPGGPDELQSVSFSLEYAGLTFDPTDASPADGIPDAITFNPDDDPALDGFLLLVTVDEAEQLLDCLVLSSVPGTVTLPAAAVIAVTFTIPLDSPPGTMGLPAHNVTARDVNGVIQPIDEVVPGVIAIADVPTPTPSRTPSATPTRPTATPTATAPPTQRPTRTAGPPTATPGICPNGFDCTVNSSDGGCALGGASGPLWWPAPAALLLWLRRRR